MFEYHAEQFLEYVKVTRSPATHEFYGKFTKPLSRFFNDIDIETINTKHIIAYINYHRDRNPEITNSTINKHILTLKLIYEYTTNKKLNFRLLNETQKISNTIPIRTISIILKHLKEREEHKEESFRNYVMFRLFLETGLRLTEMLNLKVGDIDLPSLSIHVKVTKTNKERYVFFSELTRDHLKKLFSKSQDSEFVFINYETGKKLTTNSVQTLCRRLRKTLDIKISISPHKWRHTFASDYLKAGGSLETLRRLLGHSSLLTTQKYLHIDKDSISDEYFKITNPLKGRKF